MVNNWQGDLFKGVAPAVPKSYSKVVIFSELSRFC